MTVYRRFAKKAKKAVKKRYTTKSGGVKLAQVAKDVYKIQRSLNVEHKHLDYQIGSSGNIASQFPTKSNPIIIALNTPVRGTSYNNRVGNQIRITHMTAKYEFVFNNNSDLIQRSTVRARIIFAKNADHVPVITNLLDPDANGHYTPMSFTNTQEYKKFLWIKALDKTKSYTQPTNRYPLTDTNGYTNNPVQDPATATDVLVTTPAIEWLNKAPFFVNAMSKVSVRVSFTNGTDDVAQYKPYLLLTSDVIDSTVDYDPISVSANIRMTYVDN